MLVNRSLLTSGPAPDRRPDSLPSAHGRSRARHRALAQADETESTLDRRDRWVAELATAASRTDRLDLRRRHRIVDDDYAAVRAMLLHNLVDRPSRDGARMAGWLHGYWYYRGRLVEAVRWLELAVGALDAGSGPTGDAAGEAIDEEWLHIGLAKMLTHQGRIDRARRHGELGVAVTDRIAPEQLGAFGLDVALQAVNMWSPGDPGTARGCSAGRPLWPRRPVIR
jgi:hypothetical protein